MARTGCRGSTGSRRHQLIQGVWWWTSVRDEKRSLICRFLPLFEPTENLFPHYQTMSVMKRAQRHWEIKASYPFSQPWLFLSPFRAQPLPSFIPNVRHAKLTMVRCLTAFPHICKVLGRSWGKALFLKTAQKHRIFPSVIPSICLVHSWGTLGRQRWMKALSLHLSRFSHWLGFLSNMLLIDAMAIGQADHCFSLLWFQHFKELQNQTRKY